MNLISVLLAAFLLVGCVSTTVPDRDSGFVDVASLSAFEGCYKNCSSASEGSAVACLSDIVWPQVFETGNKPEAILIRQEDNRRLIVSAISGGIVAKTSRFDAGKDFDFINGRIELDREYLASGASQPGNVFIGVGTTQTVLGLDTDGQGRVSQSVALAGTGFLIIPVAVAATDVSRIERSESLCD
ncbi:hypothetical protein [Marinobacter mobilis]|uniref:hypothetical protein n=1 Tax=Marinobacter mobilis TaxID=488533 RepID=UPI0035C7075A